ncbi:MAG: hypothetical protein HUJ94_05395 [Bacteroidales bacterium]|nr:hypothetical protein [Bacteroidales bacterium]
MEGKIRLESLTMEELNGVVSIYPWFALARKEVCRRMAELGEDALLSSQFADAAMYVPSRELVPALVRRRGDFSDTGAKAALEAVRNPQVGTVAESAKQEGGSGRKVVVVGGDFFSQEQYDSVRTGEDLGFRQTTPGPQAQPAGRDDAAVLKTIEDRFCTETLAQIYVDQGYYDHAIRIYSKLILENPEKNSYFAALIEKLEQEYKN